MEAPGPGRRPRRSWSTPTPSRRAEVISQSPASGTLFRGETVTLVVSQGPELVEVPGGIVASGVEAAREKLEALGFVVEVRERVTYLGLGYVFSMDPDSGSMVPKGSTITLTQI